MAFDSEKMRVLIVVDVQQCFIEGTLGALPGHDQNMQIFKKRISDYVNRVKNSKEYDIIVFTKDSHPPNHSSFQIGHYPPHCTDCKKRGCTKRTSYAGLPAFGIGNMLESTYENKYNDGKPNLTDCKSSPDKSGTDGYETDNGKELIKEFETITYNEKINTKSLIADKTELIKLDTKDVIEYKYNIDGSKDNKFSEEFPKHLQLTQPYIIRLNKGELCNFDANGAFYYHVEYKQPTDPKSPMDPKSPLEPNDILDQVSGPEHDVSKLSTGLAESLIKQYTARNKNKIEIDVCGLVTNICVVKTCITGMNIFKKLNSSLPVNFKILNEYCYNLHLPFITNAYKQIKDAGHIDKISFSTENDAYNFHPYQQNPPPVTYAISDPEGFNLYSLLNPNTSKTIPIVICGDLLDSTTTTTNDELTKLKSFNLFNIHEVIKSDSNVTLTLGNRDLNKIKCRYLCTLNTPAFEEGRFTNIFKGKIIDLITKFNEGNIDLTPENCERLSKACVTGKIMPWTHKMQHWWTFWNFKTVRDFRSNDAKYCENADIFHKRFLDIFGADGSEGTMSAKNLLETIPYELFGETSKTYTPNYKAFIVLAVFKSMMINIKPEFTAKFDVNGVFVKNTTKINSSLFKGWLCEMYEKSVMCLASIVKQNVFLFSHAGMPLGDNVQSDVMEKYRTEELSILHNPELYNIESTVGKMNIQKTDKLYPNLNIVLQAGGDQTLVNKVTKYNDYFKNKLINPIVVNDSAGSTDIGVPTDIMVQLLAFTSQYSEATKKYSSASGPVNLPTDKWKTAETHYKISGMRVHQIHGHSPQGFGCDITPLFNEDGFYGSIVNLDNSNTFMSSNKRKYGDDNINKKSYNYLEIHNDGEYTVDTSLLIDFKGFDVSTQNTIVGFNKYVDVPVPVKITFSSKEHLLDISDKRYSTLTNLYNNLKQKENYPQMTLDRKFSGFIGNDTIVIMTMEPPMKFFIHVHLKNLDLTNSESISTGGYSRRNRRNTNRTQRNRNSKRGYLTTIRKSRNQQKQTKNRKCTCANCRSMRR